MKPTFLTSIFLCAFLFFGFSVNAQRLGEDQIDSLVQKAMHTFNVPGIAVAILKDGEVRISFLQVIVYRP